jgi:hypothetical protein
VPPLGLAAPATAHYSEQVHRPDPVTAPERASSGSPDPAAPAAGDFLLPDADEGDPHRPGDSVGVPPPVAALRPARLRTAA